MKMFGVVILLLLWFLCLLGVCWKTSASVVLIGNNVTLSFDDVEANFVKGSGKCGVLYLANPLDACSDLSKKVSNDTPPFALVIRGGCSFDEKVRRVQEAGFEPTIVYDNDDGFLVSKDEKETKHLESLEGAESRLRLFAIDLLDYDSLVALINGCAGVFHLASPCSVDQVNDPQVPMQAIN